MLIILLPLPPYFMLFFNLPVAPSHEEDSGSLNSEGGSPLTIFLQSNLSFPVCPERYQLTSLS